MKRLFEWPRKWWSAHRRAERQMREQRMRETFRLADTVLEDGEEGRTHCLCIMHEGVAVERYYGNDSHKRMIEDLERYRRVAVEQMRAEESEDSEE